MRASIILSLVASTLAYTITSPSETTVWKTTGAQSLTWTKVSTDNSTFDVVLTNEDRSFLPTNNVKIATGVDGTKGSFSVTLPSSGITPGNGFRINFLQSDSPSILVQSSEFNITKGADVATTGGATKTDGSPDSTGTDTANPEETSTKKNASGLAAATQTGFMAVFIAAVALFA